MGEQNGKNVNIKKGLGNVSKSDAKKADKQKMKELTRKKRELEEQLDELKGNTVKGMAVCILVFLLIIGLSLGISVGMVKLDVGGVASTLLAPLIGDIPIMRSILPAEMQRKSSSELAVEQAQAEAEAQAMAEEAQAKAEQEAALQDYVDTYSAMKPQDAASLFESMIPDKEDIVISILENLTPQERGAILSSMSVASAADLTEKMKQ